MAHRRHKTDRAADATVASGQAQRRQANRDVVTGAPLSPEIPYFMRVVDDYAVLRDVRVDFMPTPHERADGMEPQLSDVPTRIHVAAVETNAAGEGGSLGGHRFSGAFARYMASVKPLLIAKADREDVEWWTTLYGVERMHRRFVERYGEERGSLAAQAVLEYLRADIRSTDCFDVMDRIAGAHAKPMGWLRTMLDLAERYAHQRKTA